MQAQEDVTATASAREVVVPVASTECIREHPLVGRFRRDAEGDYVLNVFEQASYRKLLESEDELEDADKETLALLSNLKAEREKQGTGTHGRLPRRAGLSTAPPGDPPLDSPRESVASAQLHSDDVHHSGTCPPFAPGTLDRGESHWLGTKS